MFIRRYNLIHVSIEAVFWMEGEIHSNEIPLTNKAQGANQLATVGNINAFMPNYTEAVWKKESEL